MRWFYLANLFVVLVFPELSAQQAGSPDVISPSIFLLRAPADADSLYITKYCRENDIRLMFGAQGSSLAYGSWNEEGDRYNDAMYHNVNDLVGFGLTYKWIDFDLSFSMPDSKLLEEERQNLSQFRLFFSLTGRKLAVRLFYTNSEGIIVADQASKFVSNPDVQVMRTGAQLTYYFNNKKYSYRAANFQNELQRRSAGSFLIRLEPFYRTVGTGSPLVPAEYDIPSTYGEQVGLQYVNAPGMIVMPGYGHNFAAYHGKIFVSPMVFLGPGFAVNVYRSESGKYTSLNAEWAGAASLSVGYNGRKAYVTLRCSYDTAYFPLNPSYFTTSDFKISLTAGLRFNHLEKFVPTRLF
jgi:Domain of unknown function (DUF4421)